MEFLIAKLESKERNGLSGSLHWKNRPEFTPLPLAKVKLRESDKVVLGEESKTLKELVDVLANWDPCDKQSRASIDRYWNELAQYQIGTHLAEQLFSPLSKDDRARLDAASSVRLVIQTQHEFVARLPWVCLQWNRQFVATKTWTVSISSVRLEDWKTVEFPRSARLLVIAPEPSDQEKTDSDSHLTELEKELSDGDNEYRLGTNLRVVRTWDEFRDELTHRSPDVVYYYGHAGLLGGGQLRLAFANANGKTHLVDVPTFAHQLAETQPKPVLVYVNCCGGDAAGPTGIGWQLSGQFDSVVTNRTVAKQKLVREQARTFLVQLIRFDQSPELSQRAAYCLVGNPGLAFRTPEWLTQTIYSRYATWKFRPVGPNDPHPHWPHLLNRQSQFGIVTAAVGNLLNPNTVRGAAFVWMGDEEAGLDSFHHRLEVELPIQMNGRFTPVPIRLVWPDAVPSHVGADLLWGNMIRNALKINSLAELASALHRKAGFSQETQLAYFRHTPIVRSKHIEPPALSSYLKWWSENVVRNLAFNQRCILGVSYQVPETEGLAFYRALVRTHRLASCFVQGVPCECQVLDPLHLVTETDMDLFFRRYNSFAIPPDRSDEVITFVIEKTGGRYTLIVELLKQLLKEGPSMDLEAWYAKRASS